MENIGKYLSLAAATLLLAACSGGGDDAANDDGGNGGAPVALRLRSAGIASRGTVQSTQIEKGETVSAFVYKNSSTALGDVIAENVSYTADGDGGLTLNEGSTQVYFPSDGTPIDIKATHGMIDMMSVEDATSNATRSKFAVTINTQQTTESYYKQSDALYAASMKVESTQEAVPLTFYHILSKLELTVTTHNLGSEISGIRLKKMKTTAVFSPDDTKLESQSDRNAMISGQDSESSVYMPSTTYDRDATVETKESNDVILIPQDMSAKVIVFSLKNGEAYAYTFPENTVFESGKKYSYTVDISNPEGVTLTSAQVTDWVDGDDIDGDASKVCVIDKETHTVTLFKTGRLTADMITEAMGESGELVVAGTINNADIETISTKKSEITVLDLSKAEGEELAIGQYAFADGILKDVKLSESFTSINTGAFQNCVSLETINIPKTVQSIGNDVFIKCEKLTSVEIPEGITYLPGWIFYYCSGLKEVTLPESLTQIGNAAFAGCESLKSITIPANVTSIASVALSTSSLESVYMMSTTPPKIEYRTFMNISESLKIFVPKDCSDAYKSAENWSNYADRIVEQE